MNITECEMRDYLHRCTKRVQRAREFADSVERDSWKRSHVAFLGLSQEQKEILLRVTDLTTPCDTPITFPVANDTVLALQLESRDEGEAKTSWQRVISKQRQAMAEIHLVLEKQLEQEKALQEQRRLEEAEEQRLLSIRAPKTFDNEYEDEELTDSDSETSEEQSDETPPQRDSSEHAVGSNSSDPNTARGDKRPSLLNADPKDLVNMIKNRRQSVVASRRFSTKLLAGQAFCQELGYAFGPQSFRRDSRPEINMTPQEKYANYAPHPLLPKFTDRELAVEQSKARN